MELAQRLLLGQAAAGSSALLPINRSGGNGVLARFENLLRPEFWIDPAMQVGNQIAALVPRVVVGLIMLGAVMLAYRVGRRMVVAAMGDNEIDPGLRGLLGRALKWSVIGFGLTLAAHQAGVEITALLAGASIFGTTVAFASEETLANFIAAITIAWDKPFKVGEKIGIGDVVGIVDKITFRSTRILVGTDVIVHPNRFMTKSKIVNHSYNRTPTVRVKIRIDRDESIDRARSILLSLTLGDKSVLTDPKPQVIVSGIKDGDVELTLQFRFQDTANPAPSGEEYLERAKKAFEEWGVRMPIGRPKRILCDSPTGGVLIETLTRRAAASTEPLRAAG